MKTHAINVVHSEAWINTQPIQPTPGGSLHVILDINSNTHARHFLVKTTPQGINPAILLLEVKAMPYEIYISNPQQLTYVEHLASSDQYSLIEISDSNGLLCSISKIPIIK